jgi:hypothetical protein
LAGCAEAGSAATPIQNHASSAGQYLSHDDGWQEGSLEDAGRAAMDSIKWVAGMGASLPVKGGIPRSILAPGIPFFPLPDPGSPRNDVQAELSCNPAIEVGWKLTRGDAETRSESSLQRQN